MEELRVGAPRSTAGCRIGWIAPGALVRLALDLLDLLNGAKSPHHLGGELRLDDYVCLPHTIEDVVEVLIVVADSIAYSPRLAFALLLDLFFTLALTLAPPGARVD
jgi:hypothetical protein